MTEHNITDEMVMALADGELQPHEAEAVRAAIDKESRLQKLYQDMIHTGKVLEKAFGDLSEGAAYDKLVQQIRTEGAAPQDLRPKPENVVWLNFKKLKIEFSEMRRMAASLVVGLFFGGLSWQAYIMTTAVPIAVATKPLVFRGGPSELQEKAFSAADEKLLTNYNLARLYEKQGRFGKADEIWEGALDPGYPDVAVRLGNLASLYIDQGRFGEAEPLMKRALAINEKALGPEHPGVATSLNNLAALYRTQGRYDEAEPLFKRALAIQEKALGPEHPDVAGSLGNLALLYSDQSHFGEAEPLYKRSIEIEEKALGPKHPDVARSLNDLALLYYKQGRYGEAEPLFKRSLAIIEKR